MRFSRRSLAEFAAWRFCRGGQPCRSESPHMVECDAVLLRNLSQRQPLGFIVVTNRFDYGCLQFPHGAAFLSSFYRAKRRRQTRRQLETPLPRAGETAKCTPLAAAVLLENSAAAASRLAQFFDDKETLPKQRGAGK